MSFFLVINILFLFSNAYLTLFILFIIFLSLQPSSLILLSEIPTDSLALVGTQHTVLFEFSFLRVTATNKDFNFCFIYFHIIFIIHRSVITDMPSANRDTSILFTIYSYTYFKSFSYFIYIYCTVMNSTYRIACVYTRCRKKRKNNDHNN